MNVIAYKAVVVRADDGRYVLTFPDFGWGATDGATEQEALGNAEDCLDAILTGYIHDDDEIPEPTAASAGEHIITPSTLMATKVALYVNMRRQKVNNSELARRLHVDEKSVRRLVDPAHKSKLEKLDAALRAIGLRLAVTTQAYS